MPCWVSLTTALANNAATLDTCAFVLPAKPSKAWVKVSTWVKAWLRPGALSWVARKGEGFAKDDGEGFVKVDGAGFAKVDGFAKVEDEGANKAAGAAIDTGIG